MREPRTARSGVACVAAQSRRRQACETRRMSPCAIWSPPASSRAGAPRSTAPSTTARSAAARLPATSTSRTWRRRASGPTGACSGSRPASAPSRSTRSGPYWEAYFDLEQVKDAHDRRRCRHENGEEPWACSTCDCTAKLEAGSARQGRPFRDPLDRRDPPLAAVGASWPSPPRCSWRRSTRRWWSACIPRGVYLLWQSRLTFVSNRVPFALFDLLLALAAVTAAVRSSAARRPRRSGGASAGARIGIAAVARC